MMNSLRFTQNSALPIFSEAQIIESFAHLWFKRVRMCNIYASYG